MIPKVKISMYALEVKYNGHDIQGDILIKSEDYYNNKDKILETLEKAAFTFSINNNAIMYYVRAIDFFNIFEYDENYHKIIFKGKMELRDDK